MKTWYLTIAAAAAGLLVATSSASATPVAPVSAASMGIDHVNAAVEPVHYRRYHRAARRHYRPRFSGPFISFGLAPVVRPYYAYPYRYRYSPYYGSPYPYGYSYGYSPGFSFGFHIR